MKIAVAMSGGVDSSTAALLLKDEGHEVIGLTAELSAGIIRRYYGAEFLSSSIESARSVATALGIPLHIINIEKDFSAMVVDPFCTAYLGGKTPNPCVRCNPQIKFGKLLDCALDLGCEKIATGHYAKIKLSDSGRYYISGDRNDPKDQSYFLFMLSQDSLRHTVFPLGRYTKKDILKIAKDRGLPVAERPESQEICFIPDNRYPEFIEKITGISGGPGEIVDIAGNVIGRHRGIHHYTIGQRRGLGIASSRPLYVVSIDAGQNRIVAGYREDLEIRALTAVDIHYMKEPDLDGRHVLVKTRSTQGPVPASLENIEEGILAVFSEPQIGISPGQAAVFYNDDMDVLGGGIIERSIAKES